MKEKMAMENINKPKKTTKPTGVSSFDVMNPDWQIKDFNFEMTLLEILRLMDDPATSEEEKVVLKKTLKWITNGERTK